MNFDKDDVYYIKTKQLVCKADNVDNIYLNAEDQLLSVDQMSISNGLVRGQVYDSGTDREWFVYIPLANIVYISEVIA